MPKNHSAAPPLVEILKRLDRHRWELWQRTYGKIEKADEQEGALLDFCEALERGHNRIAAKRLIGFIKMGGYRVSDEDAKGLQEKVTAAKQRGRATGITMQDAAMLAGESYRRFTQLRDYQLSQEEMTAYCDHPLTWLCEELETCLGIARDDLMIAAERLNTRIGLRYHKKTNGTEWSDWLWMVKEFGKLDDNGTTERLWEEMLQTCPQVADICVAQLAKGGDDSRSVRGRTVTASEHDERKLTAERWIDFQKNYKKYEYTKASFELFTQWGVDKFDDFPSDDPDKVKRILRAYQRTPNPQNIEAGEE